MLRSTIRRAHAIARASAADVLRRPGGVVALAMATTVLAFTPSVAARALDSTGALASGLAVSSIHIYATIAALWLGPGLTSAHHPLGFSAEYAVTSLRPLEYVAGRVLGLTAVVGLHAALLASVAAISCVLAGVGPGGALLAAPATAAIVALSVLALGATLGALAGTTTGALLLGVVLVGARLAPPGLTDSTWVPLLVPDTLRLETHGPRTAGTEATLLASAALLVSGIGWTICTATALAWRGAARADTPE